MFVYKQVRSKSKDDGLSRPVSSVQGSERRTSLQRKKFVVWLCTAYTVHFIIFYFLFGLHFTSLPASPTSNIPQNQVTEPIAFIRKAQVCGVLQIVQNKCITVRLIQNSPFHYLQLYCCFTWPSCTSCKDTKLKRNRFEWMPWSTWGPN